MTWFQTSHYCRAKVEFNLINWVQHSRSTTFEMNLAVVEYITKNWALAMMLKALPLVHFWSVLLLKEQMMTSVRKTLKTLVWSAQNQSISSEIFRFLLNYCFLVKFAPKIPRKLAHFPANVSLKIPWNLTFFTITYQKKTLKLFTWVAWCSA